MELFYLARKRGGGDPFSFDTNLILDFKAHRFRLPEYVKNMANILIVIKFQGHSPSLRVYSHHDE